MKPAEWHTATPPSRRFSVSHLLLWAAIVGLTVAVISIRSELSRVTREVAHHRPLSVQQVATQFEQRTSLGPFQVQVQDVRHSPEEDAYKVIFAWENTDTQENWSTDVKLRGNGYGEYLGTIRSPEFTRPLGYSDGFHVVVKSPSPLADSQQGR